MYTVSLIACWHRSDVGSGWKTHRPDRGLPSSQLVVYRPNAHQTRQRSTNRETPGLCRAADHIWNRPDSGPTGNPQSGRCVPTIYRPNADQTRHRPNCRLTTLTHLDIVLMSLCRHRADFVPTSSQCPLNVLEMKSWLLHFYSARLKGLHQAPLSVFTGFLVITTNWIN